MLLTSSDPSFFYVEKKRCCHTKSQVGIFILFRWPWAIWHKIKDLKNSAGKERILGSFQVLKRNQTYSFQTGTPFSKVRPKVMFWKMRKTCELLVSDLQQTDRESVQRTLRNSEGDVKWTTYLLFQWKNILLLLLIQEKCPKMNQPFLITSHNISNFFLLQIVIFRPKGALNF